jgi:hypothetical protein
MGERVRALEPRFGAVLLRMSGVAESYRDTLLETFTYESYVALDALCHYVAENPAAMARDDRLEVLRIAAALGHPTVGYEALLGLRERATLADVIALVERGEPAELIDGDVARRTIRLPRAGYAQFGLAAALTPFRRRGGPGEPAGWWLMTEVEVLYAETEEIFRHDALGFRRERVRERPDGAPVRERPDWACEVLSTSTARIDLVKRQRTLVKHGVPHYWLLDPENQTLMVLRLTEGGYLNVLNDGVGDVVLAEPFEAVEIYVADIFGATKG